MTMGHEIRETPAKAPGARVMPLPLLLRKNGFTALSPIVCATSFQLGCEVCMIAVEGCSTRPGV
jgi:hypothetical protein